MSCSDVLADVPHAAVQEAQRWLGTPYRHQGCAYGVGCDCLGLVRGIWRALYGAEPEAPPPYTRDWAERAPDEALWQAALRHLEIKARDDLGAGDVILFRMRSGGVAKHLGIQVDATRFVHAMSGRGVVCSAFGPAWARRAVARFRFPAQVPPVSKER